MPEAEKLDKQLYLHCGGTRANYNDVASITTPEPVNRHYPIPHTTLIDGTKLALENAGCDISTELYGLNHDGGDLFALFEIEHPNPNGTFNQVVGLRNSHIQHFSAGLCAGGRVFVCDNLMFSAEIKVSRKHTRFIMRDLQGLLSQSMPKLADKWIDQQIRYDAYHDRIMTDEEVHDLVIKASLDYHCLPNSSIKHVINEWREPSFDEFTERNAWSLFNCFTHVAKRAPSQIVNRTLTLHNLFDGVCQEQLAEYEKQTELQLDTAVDKAITTLDD